MASADSTGEDATEVVQNAGESVYVTIRDSLFTGIGVVVPVVITIYVLTIVLGAVDSILEPLVILLEELDVDQQISRVLLDVVAFAGLFAVVLGIGLLTQFHYGEAVISYFDLAMERIPGVGSVYKSFRQMSDVMLESSAENFRDVKLVEFPHQGTYTLGFKTTDTPPEIETAAGLADMETLFLPMAPNPVMGGFLSHVPADRVHDVDMTIEEGLQTVVTMGVATTETGRDDASLSASELQQLTSLGYAEPTEVRGPEEKEE